MALNFIIPSHLYQVRGSAEQDNTFHEVCSLYCGLVDRENEDYHDFFHFSTCKDANGWLLHSLCFYFLLSARAIWEEERRAIAVAQHGGAAAAAVAVKTQSFPSFLLEIASQRPRR